LHFFLYLFRQKVMNIINNEHITAINVGIVKIFTGENGMILIRIKCLAWLLCT